MRRATIILLLLTACKSYEPDLTNKKDSVLIKDHTIASPRIIVSKGERISINSTAEKFEKNTNEDGLLTGNVVADFFDENGNHMSILYSDSAIINEISNNFQAFGHVQVISDSGLVLTTSEIIWDNRYKMVVSHDSVMFTTENLDTLYGVGFESDVDLSHYTILKPTGVTGRGFK